MGYYDAKVVKHDTDDAIVHNNIYVDLKQLFYQK